MSERICEVCGKVSDGLSSYCEWCGVNHEENEYDYDCSDEYNDIDQSDEFGEW